MNRTLRHLALVLSLVFTIVACAAPAQPSSSLTGPVRSEQVTSAPTVNLGMCFDGTSSIPPEVIHQGIEAAVAVVNALPVVPASFDRGSPPIAGINVQVRRVSRHSSSSVADALVDIQIPMVPGLSPPPDPSDYQAYAESSRLWREARDSVTSIADQAVVAREQLLNALPQIDVRGDDSEIYGCVTALRDSFPVGSHAVVIVVSDLAQTATPQLRGDFSGLTLLVAHYCPDAAVCVRQETEWREVFEYIGVPEVEFVSFDQLAAEAVRILGV